MIDWLRRVLGMKGRPAPVTPRQIVPNPAPAPLPAKKAKADPGDFRQMILNGEPIEGHRFRTLDLSGELLATCLPAGLHCSTLNLSRTRWVHELPAGLEVDLRLDLTECTELVELPRGLKTGSLVLTDCTRLRALPEEMDVNFLTIEGCTALREWPESAQVTHGSVHARGCVNLSKLPATLTRLTNLDVSGCRKISALPEGLELSGWLDLADTGITRLPESLRGVALRWRGVTIDAQIAFCPETLAADQVLHEQNAEVRRVMVERLGLEGFLKGANAKVLHEDTDAGGPRQLLRVPLPGDEDIVCVSVRCPSTGRHYLIRVPPKMKTCHEAVAWTAGFDNPDDYHPLAET